MTEIYQRADYESALKQKKKCLTYFLIVTGVYALLAAAVFIYFLFEPYGSKKETWLLVIEGVLTGLYVIFAYVYMAIRFSRVRRYCIFLLRALERKPTSGTASFMRFNSEIMQRDGVDFKSMTFIEWSEKEKDFMERNVFLDVEKQRPDFRAGDEVSFNTYANVLVSYKINNRTDLVGTPFEEA